MIKSKEHLVFTVIAPNYGAQAMVLGESIAKSIPDAIFRIVVLQDCPDVSYIQNGIDSYLTSSFTEIDHKAVNFQDFDWSEFDVTNCVNQYDLLEFATSVKPTILKNYIGEGYNRVTYLDPDIQVFSDFTELFDNKKSVSVTPHILEDFPMDSKLPNQQSILYAGIFNLGFISVTLGALPFLKWWEEKLNKYCSMDVKAGYHVDQRWVDWAMNFVDVDVMRDPGLNVAYWNLHERSISDVSPYRIDVNGAEVKALRFFHFSGFIGPSVSKISRHCTRQFSETKALKELLANYYKRRAYWKHFLGVSIWSLGGRLAGSSLPESWRQDALTLNRKLKSHRFERKFEIETQDCYFCNCSECRSQFASEAINSLFNLLATNNVSTVDFSDQKTLHGKLRSIGYQKLYHGKHLKVVAPNANLCLIGYFGAPTGVGQMARNTLRLLEDSGITLNIHILRTSFDDEDLLDEYLIKSQMNGKETSVIGFVNADMWIEHLVKPRLIDLARQNVAAVWAWEIEEFPQYFKESARYATKIFAISQFSASALSNFLNAQIEVFPTYGNIAISNDQIELTENKTKKYILSRFDAKSVIERKNPSAVLETWDLVKAKLPDHELVIKTIDFVKNSPPALLEKINNSERVVLIDEVYSEEQNRNLLHGSSAYISLHRAEGLGLNILEALAADIPVIATNYSGLSVETGSFFFPVEYELIQVGDKAFPYPADAFWADPSINSAAHQLVTAVNLFESGEWKAGRRTRLENLRIYFQKAQTFSVSHCAQLLSTARSPAVAKSSFSKKIAIRDPKYFLRLYSHFPQPVRIVARRIFLRYFTY